MKTKRLILFIVLLLVLPAATLIRNHQLFFVRQESIGIQDFAYYMTVFSAFWSGKTNSIYDPNSQAKALSSLLGLQTAAPMPVAYSPSALLIYYPFILLSEHSLFTAYLFWVGVSLTLLVVALLPYLRKDEELKGLSRYRSALYGIIAFYSSAMFSGVALGQTAILGLALCLLLFNMTKEPSRSRSLITDVLSAGTVLVLSIKLPYLAIGGLTLLLFARWRAIILTAAGGVILVVFGGLRFGWEWMLQFSDALSLYTRVFPARYSLAAPLEAMTGFRWAFAEWLGDSLAQRIALIVYLGSMLVCLLIFLRNSLARLVPSSYYGRAAFSILVGIYLLFSPHANFYEDLLVLIPVLICSAGEGSQPSSNRGIIVTALALVLVLNHEFFPTSAAPLLWLVKLLLIAYGLRQRI